MFITFHHMLTWSYTTWYEQIFNNRIEKHITNEVEQSTNYCWTSKLTIINMYHMGSGPISETFLITFFLITTTIEYNYPGFYYDEVIKEFKKSILCANVIKYHKVFVKMFNIRFYTYVFTITEFLSKFIFIFFLFYFQRFFLFTRW